jgi:hypothetical protein
LTFAGQGQRVGRKAGLQDALAMKIKMKSHNVCALAAVITALAGPAFATVNVRLDQNTLMALKAPAGTVLIGDPSVVDVSLISPRQIAILGRGYGQTNVIITDRTGRVIFQEVVEVSRASQNRVSVYRGPLLSNFTCAPGCERTPSPGEDNSSYTTYASSYKDHTTTAQSNGMGGGGGSMAASGGASPPPSAR